MLVQRYRPKFFRDVVGADIPVRVLKEMAKKPSLAPRSVILYGEYGLGKTSLAHIFGRAVNCEQRKGEPCGICEHCVGVEAGTIPLRLCFDSAVVGNVDSIRSIRDNLTYSYPSGYRVIIFDEVHLSSQAAQSALLDVLENAPRGVFYVFCTTDIDKIIPTIQSRSIALELLRAPDGSVFDNLRKISIAEGLEVSDDVLTRIVRRSGGHVRDSVQQLQVLQMIGEESYLLDYPVLMDEFEAWFAMLMEDGTVQERSKVLLSKILQNPVKSVRMGFENYIKKLCEEIFLDKTQRDGRIQSVVGVWLRNQRFVKSTNDWYVFLLQITELFAKKSQQQQEGGVRSRFSRT